MRSFALRFCETLAEVDPTRFTVALPKVQRRGGIFLDYLRNQRASTAILPYSVRGKAGMPVAAPIAWRELDEIYTAQKFTIANAAKLRLRAKSKLLSGWRAEQALPA